MVDTATWDVQVVDSPKDVPPGSTGVDASLASGVFTISWDAVTGVTNYLVEHRIGGDQETWTSVGYTPSGGVTCGTTYDFRMRAYGDGAFYVVDWGRPSETDSVTTEDCNAAPEFEAATYNFTVSEDTKVGTVTVTITVVDATCSGGDAVPNPDDNPGLVADCETLLGLRDTLRGTATLNWGYGVAMTTWDGVTIGGTPSRVTGLNLGDLGLAGSMPTALGSLSGLQNLNLSRNQLTGAIPTQLGNLSDLTALWLYENQFKGGIPSELGSLSNPVWLILSGNELTGAIPPQIGDLTGLSHLWLQDNQLSGEIPPGIGGLASMQILRMHNNELTGPIPWQLGNLTGLSIIHMSGNELEGYVPPALEDVTNNDFSTLGLAFCTESGPVSTPTVLAVTLTGETFTISWTAVTEAYKYGVEYRIEGYGEEWLGLPTTDELQPRSYMWRDPLSIIDTSGRISINMTITCVSPSLMGALSPLRLTTRPSV